MRILRIMRTVWTQITMSEDEFYLAQSVDVADLERRLRYLSNRKIVNIVVGH